MMQVFSSTWSAVASVTGLVAALLAVTAVIVIGGKVLDAVDDALGGIDFTEMFPTPKE